MIEEAPVHAHCACSFRNGFRNSYISKAWQVCTKFTQTFLQWDLKERASQGLKSECHVSLHVYTTNFLKLMLLINNYLKEEHLIVVYGI